MTTGKLQNSLFSLLLVSIFFTPCNGQTKTRQTNEPVAGQQSFTSKNTRLTKTQGTDQFQNVHCIIQDREGNIWFGTTGEGVYRYDGEEFTQFTVKDGLSNNKIWSILEDRSGNIWFGTDNGINRYGGKKISQIPIPVSKKDYLFPNISANNTAWPDNAIGSIMQDKKGIIWFGTDNGVYCYNGKIFSYFLDDPRISNTRGLTLKSIQCLFEDKTGNVWFGSGPQASEGICLFDGKSLTNFKPHNEGWIRKITEDKNGILLFGTRHIGLIVYNGKTFSDYFEPQNLQKQELTSFLLDSRYNIWYGSDYTNSDPTTGGLWKSDGKSFIEFTKKDGLSNTSIYSLAEDKAGNIWIGTRNCGLYRYDGKTFTAFSE